MSHAPIAPIAPAEAPTLCSETSRVPHRLPVAAKIFATATIARKAGYLRQRVDQHGARRSEPVLTRTHQCQHGGKHRQRQIGIEDLKCGEEEVKQAPVREVFGAETPPHQIRRADGAQERAGRGRGDEDCQREQKREWDSSHRVRDGTGARSPGELPQAHDVVE
jgi:hypothetical protein